VNLVDERKTMYVNNNVYIEIVCQSVSTITFIYPLFIVFVEHAIL